MMRKKERGFTLLLAALVASITLMLGAAIFEIAQKELILSSIGRDSQYAFYAADTGAECALYHDIRFQRFPTSTASVRGDVVCDGDNDIDVAVTTVGGTRISTFEFEPNDFCVNVSVRKIPVAATPGTYDTVIHADGYNSTCDVVDDSPRALQRSVELHY